LIWSGLDAIIFGAGGWPALEREGHPMAWKKPKIVEISLALEINSYACAEIA
jgi:coenzyme PQQ precursor peptide PqqA